MPLAEGKKYLKDEGKKQGQSAVIKEPVDVDRLALDRALASELLKPFDHDGVLNDGAGRRVEGHRMLVVQDPAQEVRFSSFAVDGQSR